MVRPADSILEVSRQGHSVLHAARSVDIRTTTKSSTLSLGSWACDSKLFPRETLLLARAKLAVGQHTWSFMLREAKHERKVARRVDALGCDAQELLDS